MFDTLTRVLLVSLLVAPTVSAAHTDARQDHERRLRFTLTLENPEGETLRKQSVALYMPATNTGGQTLVDLSVSVPHRVRHDAAGNTVLEIDFDAFPAYATRVVSISATVRLALTPLRDAARLARESWLGEQPFIESREPAIVALATELRGESDAATAHAIYEWERTHLAYAGYVAEDRGARDAIVQRRGDCTEYAYLAAALARASGIPARVLGGYVVSADAAPRSRDYHNWAELFVDGQWRLLDAQKERFAVAAEDYVILRVITPDGSGTLASNHRFAVAGRISARMD